MKPLFNHSLITSFALYLDHVLLNTAQAYANVTGSFYPQIDSGVRGNVWQSPYKSWVWDSCASGATIISGAYTSSGQFLTRDSGIVIDYWNGRIISPYKWGSLSGSYSRKEYNIYTSTEGEINWWLENVYGADKDITYTITGIPSSRFAAPCIILTNARDYNDQWALGGLQDSRNLIRTYTISPANAPFLQEGVDSVMRDIATRSVALVSFGDVPLGNSGDIKNGSTYCYDTLCAQYSPPQIYIEAVHNVKVNQKTNNSTTFSVTVAEFDVSTIRQGEVR